MGAMPLNEATVIINAVEPPPPTFQYAYRLGHQDRVAAGQGHTPKDRKAMLLEEASGQKATDYD